MAQSTDRISTDLARPHSRLPLLSQNSSEKSDKLLAYLLKIACFIGECTQTKQDGGCTGNRLQPLSLDTQKNFDLYLKFPGSRRQ